MRAVIGRTRPAALGFVAEFVQVDDHDHADEHEHEHENAYDPKALTRFLRPPAFAR
jgi:hypothetical protein